MAFDSHSPAWLRTSLAATMLILFLGWAGSEARAGEAAFAPDIEKAMPQIGEAVDLGLFKAGKPQKRWQRAQDLRRGLPPIEGLEPFHQADALLKWLASVALVESAVAASPGSAEESWTRTLLSDYHQLADKESVFSSFRSVVRVMAVQRGAQLGPLAAFADQLYGLSAYGRRGVEWLARRYLGQKPSPALRAQLLGSLISVYRREGRYEEMRKTAVTWAEAGGGPAASLCRAEAAFELGRQAEGDRALAEGRKAAKSGGGTDLRADLDRAETRRRLMLARQALAKGRTGPRQAAVFGLYKALHEPWRILAALPAAEVAALGNPEVDERYLDALLSDDFDFEGAWRYGRMARGKPPRPGFLGRRIGAGLAMVLRGLFADRAHPVLDGELVTAIRADLKAFRPADPRLADLTELYLSFVRVLTGQDVFSLARQIRAPVAAYLRAHPTDLAGVQMAFLIGILDPEAPRPWAVVQAHLEALGNQPAEADFLPLLAGAAIRHALGSGKPDALRKALTVLEAQKAGATPAGLLWRAHLQAVDALMAEGQAQGAKLQQAVDAYGQAIRAWGEAPAEGKGGPEVLCMATVSLATLLMQGQALEEAGGLLEQSAPICGQDPASVALSAILAIAQNQTGQGADGADPVALLRQAASAQTARQAEIQSRLWLGLVAEANGDANAAAEQFESAARTLAQERGRGSPLVLAPDLRSLVAQSGQFDMGSGHDPSSPFGLALQITVSTRMVLFPPAAVSEEKLSKYMNKKGKSDK